MMRVKIIFEASVEEDGFEAEITYSRNNVETLEDLSWTYSEASRAGGWTYTDAVSIHTDEGKTYRSPS
jgi:hypothetical protein